MEHAVKIDYIPGFYPDPWWKKRPNSYMLFSTHLQNSVSFGCHSRPQTAPGGSERCHCPPHTEHTVANGSQCDVSSQRWALVFSFMKRSCAWMEPNNRQDYRIQTFISDKVGLLRWDIHMNDDVNEEVFLLFLALSLLLLVFFIVTQFIGVMGISLRSFSLIFISSNFFSMFCLGFPSVFTWSYLFLCAQSLQITPTPASLLIKNHSGRVWRGSCSVPVICHSIWWICSYLLSAAPANLYLPHPEMRQNGCRG